MKSQVSNVLLILVGGFFASLLIYSMWKQVAQYYVVTLAILAVGSWLLMWLNPKLKANLVIVLLATGLSLLTVELVLTIWDPQLFNQMTKLQKDDTDSEILETKSRLEYVKDFHDAGVEAYPSLSAPDLLRAGFTHQNVNLLPLSGISNQTTVLCSGFDGPIVYESDAHGFNNPTDYWQLEGVQYAIIGDSFVHGRCPAKEGIVESFRRTHESTLNVGLSGSGPLMELAITKEYLSRIKPSVVLWFYFEGNDLYDLLRESRHPHLNKYLGQDYYQGLRQKQGIIDSELREYVAGQTEKRDLEAPPVSFWEVMKLHALRHQLSTVMNVCPLDVSVRTMSKLDGIVSDITQTVESWGGDLYFIYLPTWERYSGTTNGCGEERFLESSKLYGEVLGILHSYDIPIIDMVQVFDDHEDPLDLWPFRKNGHYNAAGNRAVAETVIAFIEDR